MTAPVMIVAATSARMLAQSALRGGFVPVALDLFGDIDTRRDAHWVGIGNRSRSRFSSRRLQSALTRLARVSGVRGWVAGGGFEDRVELLQDCSGILPLLGNDPGLVAVVKEPAAFFGALDRYGIAHPDTRLESPASPGGWLAKRIGGTGGWHVQRCEPAIGEPVSGAAHRTGRAAVPVRSVYFQREEFGTPMSALFLGNGVDSELIGCNRLLADSVAGRPFVFQGAVGPVRLSTGADRMVRHAVESLTRHFGLKGMNSLDFLLDGDRVSVLEINPRPSATMQLYDDLMRGGMLSAHLLACGHGALLPTITQHGEQPVRGLRILYASRRLTMSPACCRRLQSLGWCHDIGRPGTRASRGDPLCSITAQAGTEPAVVAELSRRTKVIDCIWEEEDERELEH